MDKTTLIIGASGDIGSKISIELAEDGYPLLLHYNKNKESIDHIKHHMEETLFLGEYRADLSDFNQVRLMVNQIPFTVDNLIVASGSAYYGLFQDTPETTMDFMLATHIKAPWLIIQHFLPSMIKKQKGNIIFITSIWGTRGASNEVIYSTVKGAQNSFVKSLAKEVGPSGITVNGISPGFIDTKMNQHLLDEEKEAIISDIPVNRAGLPKDIAHAVKFLLNPQSNYIQGEIIHITGGW